MQINLSSFDMMSKRTVEDTQTQWVKAYEKTKRVTRCVVLGLELETQYMKRWKSFFAKMWSTFSAHLVLRLLITPNYFSDSRPLICYPLIDIRMRMSQRLTHPKFMDIRRQPMLRGQFHEPFWQVEYQEFQERGSPRATSSVYLTRSLSWWAVTEIKQTVKRMRDNLVPWGTPRWEAARE